MLEIRAGGKTRPRVGIGLLVLGGIVLVVAGYFAVQSRLGLSRLPLERTPGGSTSLEDAEQLLARYPPTTAPAAERVRALAALDSIFHQQNAPETAAVQDFFHRQIQRAVRTMQETHVATGATAWLVYNHSFIVRTPSATICFDLVRAKYLPGFELSEELMGKIVEQCDALFVSHVHADHAESFVAATFIAQGKPVVAPEQVGYRPPLYAKVTHLQPHSHEVQSLPIKGGRANLSVVVYPGHQGEDIANNVVLITTADGITVAHTGDQWDKGADFEWIDSVAEHFRVDLLLANDWTYDIVRLVRGFSPGVVIPGHANELGHEVAKRQSYALSLERKIGSSQFGGTADVGYMQPLVIMTWGESYHYERPAPAR